MRLAGLVVSGHARVARRGRCVGALGRGAAAVAIGGWQTFQGMRQCGSAFDQPSYLAVLLHGVMEGVSDRYQGIDSHWVPRCTDDPEGELSFIENGNAPGGG